MRAALRNVAHLVQKPKFGLGFHSVECLAIGTQPQCHAEWKANGVQRNQTPSKQGIEAPLCVVAAKSQVDAQVELSFYFLALEHSQELHTHARIWSQ